MHDNTMTSAERKRLRDRRAQQKLREKRDNQIKLLEDQVSYCKQNHGSIAVSVLVEKIHTLELENRFLQRQQETMMGLAGSLQRTANQMITSMHQTPPASVVDTTLSYDDQMAPSLHAGTKSTEPGCLQIAGILCTSDMAATGTMRSADKPQQGPDGQSLPGEVPFPGSPDSTRILQSSSDALCTLTGNLDSCRYWVPTSDHPPHPFLTEFDNSPQDCDESTAGTGLKEASRPSQSRPSQQMPRSSIRLPPPNHSRSRACNHSDSSLSFADSQTPSLPRWSLTPNNTSEDPLSKASSPWFDSPSAVAASPEEPEPLDLLFGSCQNFLANSIHTALRKSRVAEPERLAIGWLLYVFSKWRVHPTPESFARIPPFLWPIPEQIQQAHPVNLDMILWPALRLNLIRMADITQLPNIFDMMSCCLKVRWPWGQEILEASENDGLKMRDEFYKVFSRVEGWGLTPEFINAYPNLLDGLSVDSVTYTV
ncbi:hypothetical protein Z517_11547 [Fonsecaea pedrosoi CBS 271.37]|uniref:Unplaced genomic scaffold supercont1.8, whole genome shotgun sequence n=1 Tax=Fonsecaea pedrosoi CBS 271.37 TaxID=1442368 RepID=A0A0D2EK35_9EURO|nr:uncharacterized protein Z517_11547 [Fonsecaea pedrosoi CBS 271.37]KIW74777.1 hypothetical protein Z517_11547 [Fonsecaea pedrosoi CBS 271.37]